MSSIVKCGPSLSKLAFWVDWKMTDIISPLPGCSKRKSGKSIAVEEQQIILNVHVAKYFPEESKSGNKPQFRAGAVIAKTAAATGVSKNSVRKIVSAGKVKATFHLTISMRGQLATGKIQRNNYHYGNCGPSLTGKTMSAFLIFRQGTHRNVRSRSVRSCLY